MRNSEPPAKFLHARVKRILLALIGEINSKLKMFRCRQVQSRLNAAFPKRSAVYRGTEVGQRLVHIDESVCQRCSQVYTGLKSHRAVCEQRGGSDRLGYNLICIADRVISIRVTTQSSLPAEERSVYLK